MADRELFLSLSDDEIPSVLESTLSDMIDCRSRMKSPSLLRRWVRYGAVAASVACVVVGLVVGMRYSSDKLTDNDADTPHYCHLTGNDLSPDQVVNQAVNALDLLSRTLNAGSAGYSHHSQD